jgi:hypothetical protein
MAHVELKLEKNNEVSMYENLRYISSCEAAWRFSNLKLMKYILQCQ